MNVIPPQPIGESQLISSSIVETVPAVYSAATSYGAGTWAGSAAVLGKVATYESKYANNLNNALTNTFWWKFVGYTYEAYSVGTTYGLGHVVTDPVNHRLYESQVTGNVGQLLTNESKWLTLGATNRYAMFDMLRDTPTIGQDSITVTLAPGKRINSLGLFKLKAKEVTITMTVAGTVVYTHTADLVARRVSSWVDWFFGGVIYQKSLVLFDLPPYTLAQITITLTGVGEVACGACVVGKFVDIGRIQFGAESDAINYSTVTRDFAGNVNVLQQRRNVPKTLNDLWLPAEKVDEIRELRDTLAATPAAWVGVEDSTQAYYESIIILGFYKRFTINLAHLDTAKLSLELEEI